MNVKIAASAPFSASSRADLRADYLGAPQLDTRRVAADRVEHALAHLVDVLALLRKHAHQHVTRRAEALH